MTARRQAKAPRANTPQSTGFETHGVQATRRSDRYGRVTSRISITFEDPQAFWCLYQVLCDGLAPGTVEEGNELLIVAEALWGLQHVIMDTLLALGGGPIDLVALFTELKQHLASLSPEERALFRLGNDARRRFEALQARRRATERPRAATEASSTGAVPRARQFELDLSGPRDDGADARSEPQPHGAAARRRPHGRIGKASRR